jgi:DNA-binding NtrC family response regulator
MAGAFGAAAPWRRVEGKNEHPVTILVIEDEPMVREVLQITLERSGFRVLMAGGGMRRWICVSLRPCRLIWC